MLQLAVLPAIVEIHQVLQVIVRLGGGSYGLGRSGNLQPSAHRNQADARSAGRCGGARN